MRRRAAGRTWHRCGREGFVPFAPEQTARPLPARFADQVAAHRDCTALVDGPRRLTYGELDAMAGAIAGALLDRLGDGWEPVVLLLRQGAGDVAATLGTLRAGKAYVPLDADDPAEHLCRLADRVGARLVLCEPATAARAAALAAPGRGVMTLPPQGPPPGRELAIDPDTIACIHVTSGSTGGPKAVMDTHRNVLHNVMRYTQALRIAPADRLSVIQSPAFSGVMSSRFGALMNGAGLCACDLRTEGLERLAAVMREERLTMFHAVPSIFRSLVRVSPAGFPDVRVVRLEGDRATWHDAALHRAHFGPDCVLANGLGTTETGLCRQLRLTGGARDGHGPLPVGHPIDGTVVTVVDDARRPLPAGEAGEVAVSGRHLAAGYWDDPARTAAAFAADPADPGLRTYYTGDLGRLGADGCLVLLGRRDGGLKVGGSRVEPAEVEAHLLALAGVREAVVSTEEGRRGEGRLVARVVAAPGAADAAGLRAALAERLPAHMVPSEIVLVAGVQLSLNGKLDRTTPGTAGPDAGGVAGVQLSEDGRLNCTVPSAAGPSARGDDARAPTADEAALLALWSSVLERTGIGLDDDFFTIGGDSLAEAEVMAALEQSEGRELPGSLLAGTPTVARLAAALADLRAGAPSPAIVPLQPEGAHPPLVLVHGHDGSARVHTALARALGPGRAVWGLDAPPPGARPVAEIAALHVRALRDAQPEGPYLLGGFCFGGVVALEMARRLRADGAEVLHCAVIGVAPDDFPGRVAAAARARHRASRRTVRRLARHLGRMPQGGLRPRLAHLAGGIRALADDLGARRARPHDHRAASRVAMRGYAPAPLPGGVALYLSAEITGRYSVDPGDDWRGLAERVTVHVLPGSNDGMMRGSVVHRLAALIAADIAAAAPDRRAATAGSAP